MKPDLDILYEDNHLLVVNKPVRLATMGLPAGEETLLTRAKEYIAQRYNKPGNVYLGVVSRLDTPVSGVVVIARTSKAADRLNRQFRGHTVEKIYIAAVEGVPPPQGTLRDWMEEDSHHRKCYVTLHPENHRPSAQTSAAKEAVLHYRRLRRQGEISLLEIRLETGRKHQIRVQLSHAGWPIAGDWKYKSRIRMDQGIALHARRLTLEHPVTHERMTFIAPMPKNWPIPTDGVGRQ